MAKSSMADKALSPRAFSLLQELGAHITKARSRRKITQTDLAKRAGMSHVRLRKLEKGDPTVGLGALAQVLDVLGLLEDLSKVAHPDADAYGKALENTAQPARVHAAGRDRIDELDF